MKVITNVSDMHQEVRNLKAQTVGFVPTMGYLHDGHRVLIKHAKEENNIVVVSVFVNPLQFNQSSDLENYPRDFERDRQILERDGVDYVFYPEGNKMYPNPLTINMSIVKRTDVLCGQSRPGHFEGVVMVLSKLFNIVKPNQVYFGIKDAQQVAVVDALIQDLNFDIQLKPVPTKREKDGLAMSSRNVNLEDHERQEASEIYQSLKSVQIFIESSSTWTRQEVIDYVRNYLVKRISGEIDYVDCLSFPELTADISKDDDVIIAVAVYYKRARLIDNIILDCNGKIKYGSESDV
ncbi:pantoate--beta-alanine ligase [Aquisalibacillus elongatus]|uniref:Pantothenate synthetase n=1 Tax=Aquisalibacillus elongatus TaxID=485577 RepID=A0A3N5BKJ9_9BACI|nr:pantoate--beta-alanine ligase [Aquisalibacillus elongatus]RPF55790.1 pantothenate synthetase [Aquisalibacillus elongatus]